MILVFRMIYFVAAVSGLLVNVSEYRHARRIHLVVLDEVQSAALQLLALMALREETIRVAVQSCLAVAAVSSLYAWWQAPEPMVDDTYVVLAQCGQIAATVLLAAKAFLVRHDRQVIVRLLTAHAWKPGDPDRRRPAPETGG